MSIIFGAFIGILALQVYLVATFVDGLDAPAWLTTMTCIGVAVAGLSGLSLIPVYIESGAVTVANATRSRSG